MTLTTKYALMIVVGAVVILLYLRGLIPTTRTQLENATVKSTRHGLLHPTHGIVGNVTAPRVVRECVTGDVLGEVVGPLSLRPFSDDPLKPSATEESSQDRQKSFEKVFKSREWGGHGGNDPENKVIVASGSGSSLHWSQEMIGTLHNVIDSVKASLGVSRVTLLDVPCGDFVWMHRFLQTRDDVMYTGMDIVPELVQHHKLTYPEALYPNRRFLHADAATVRTLGTYHVVMSRMMMQHLPRSAVYQVLHKISSSGSLYALLTSINSNRNPELNLEIRGRFRAVNLEIPPYTLEPPLCMQRDGPPDSKVAWDHFIGLWKLPLNMHTRCQKIYRNRWKDSPHLLHSCTRWKNGTWGNA